MADIQVFFVPNSALLPHVGQLLWGESLQAPALTLGSIFLILGSNWHLSETCSTSGTRTTKKDSQWEGIREWRNFPYFDQGVTSFPEATTVFLRLLLADWLEFGHMCTLRPVSDKGVACPDWLWNHQVDCSELRKGSLTSLLPHNTWTTAGPYRKPIVDHNDLATPSKPIQVDATH